MNCCLSAQCFPLEIVKKFELKRIGLLFFEVADLKTATRFFPREKSS